MEKFMIRQETSENYTEIYYLIQMAFKTAKVKDGDEQDFAENLRNGKNYIPELALVAEKEGKLIGHILFTRTQVKRPDGSLFVGLLVAPLSVLLEYRNQGVGTALMREGLRIARELGYKAAFLCGDPNYYVRFGYRQTADWDISPEGDIPGQYVLGLELEEKALDDVSGVLTCC